MKRIAILTPVIPPYVGGIGKAALAEAEMLAAEFDVTIFTPKYKYIDQRFSRDVIARSPPHTCGGLRGNLTREGGSPRPPRRTRDDSSWEEQRGSVKIKYIEPFFAFGNAAILFGWRKRLKDFDTVYLHYPFFGTMEFLGFQLMGLSLRLIVRYHMDVIDKGVWKLLFWLHGKTATPFILNTASKVIASTLDYARNSNIKNLLKKYPEKFAEIPFSVDTEKFKPAPKDQDLLKKHDIEQDAKILLFVGGLDRAHYFKGLNFLLHAIKSLGYKLQATGYKLVIVGDGDLRAYYENLAKDLGINDHVRFVGKVSSEDLPKFYNLADVFVFPSIDKSEAFGIALLEALACGKAVVVSNLPGVRSLIEDGKNGFLVEPKNVTSLADRLQLSIERSEEFGKNSRELAISRFDQSSVGGRLLDTFRKI